jgi:hypothetical protein
MNFAREYVPTALRQKTTARLLGLRVRIPPGHECLYLVSVPEYLHSISDTSETTASMETTFPGMAVVCVPSALITNSQYALSASAEPSLYILSTILRFDTYPEEITFSRLSNISPRPQIPRKYTAERITLYFYR